MPRRKGLPGSETTTADVVDDARLKDARLRLDLPNYVPYRISVVGALVKRSMQNIYKDQPGLTEPEWKVLTTLAHYGPLQSGDVGLYVTLDRAAVSRALARLLERGFITRRENRGDQRMFMVDLTPAAARMYDRLAKQALEIESRILERLQPDEVTALLSLLDKVEACFRDHADRRRASLINAVIEFNRAAAPAVKPKSTRTGRTVKKARSTLTGNGSR